jgi:hypothetical protein
MVVRQTCRRFICSDICRSIRIHRLCLRERTTCFDPTSEALCFPRAGGIPLRRLCDVAAQPSRVSASVQRVGSIVYLPALRDHQLPQHISTSLRDHCVAIPPTSRTNLLNSLKSLRKNCVRSAARSLVPPKTVAALLDKTRRTTKWRKMISCLIALDVRRFFHSTGRYGARGEFSPNPPANRAKPNPLVLRS